MRKYMTKQEAIDCLHRNGVKVEYKSKTGVSSIKKNRPVGIKVLGAIDCLIHYHGRYYKLAR